MDAVSEVLIARAPKKEALNSMLGASVLAHVALFVVFVFAPAWWFGAKDEAPETIMQISLGGQDVPDKSGAEVLGHRRHEWRNASDRDPTVGALVVLGLHLEIAFAIALGHQVFRRDAEHVGEGSGDRLGAPVRQRQIGDF